MANSVASAGKAVTNFAQKLKSRCAVLLGQDGREDRRERERLPCNLKIEIQTARGPVIAAVYEISMEGILISGADAGRLPLNQSLDADDRGHRRLPDPHHRALEGRRAGAVRGAGCRLERKDRRQAVGDPRREHRIRHPRHGSRHRADQDFRGRGRSGAISIDDMFDENYVEIPGTDPVQHRTRILDWADRALPPFQEAFLAKDPRMVFCVMIDRNGYLPVHNKIYSHPQRPGDVAWNTANSRNRRIFNDPAGLAAGRNLRSYLIQSYARDMGNGKTVMMREIDVPIRVNGRHWGGFRTAYKL